MGDKKPPSSNPFAGIRDNLKKVADELVRKEAEERKIKQEKKAKALQLKNEKEAKELAQKLEETERILVEDVQKTLAEITPRDILSSGTMSFVSEAFAWFYREEETLLFPGGSTLASGSMDGTVRLWDANTGKHLRTLETEHAVTSVAFSPDDTIVASAGKGKSARLWDAGTGKHLRTLPRHVPEVNSVAFSPDGTVVATSSNRDKTICLSDPNTGERIRTLISPLPGLSGVHHIAFSPDSATLASVGGDHTISLWDPKSGSLLKQLTGHLNPIRQVAFSPDGTKVASASFHGVRTWGRKTGKQLSVTKTPETASIAYSPNGSRLATAAGRNITLLDCSKSVPRKPPISLKGHMNTVAWIAYSPDGSKLASASLDSTARIWDAETGNLLRTFKGHTGKVLSVALSSTWIFKQPRQQEIYKTIQDQLHPEGFTLSTKDGVEFTLSW
jgi:WD40 repeat protein